MNKQNLDERQVSSKNKIGSQSFLLLAYLLFIDAGLYGLGVRWLPYPANIIVILMVCLFVFLVRVIRSGSYVGPGQAKKMPYLVLAMVGAAVAAAAVLVFLLGDGRGAAAQAEDNSGGILFIISVVLLVVVGVVVLVKKRQDKDGD